MEAVFLFFLLNTFALSETKNAFETLSDFVVNTLVGTTCKTETDCDTGECCQILSEFMVVSKRQALTAPKLAVAEKTGTCQMYKTEGSHCSSFAKINGYCSCAPGLRCYTREEPLPTAILIRSMLAPRPGYQWVSTCEKP